MWMIRYFIMIFIVIIDAWRECNDVDLDEDETEIKDTEKMYFSQQKNYFDHRSYCHRKPYAHTHAHIRWNELVCFSPWANDHTPCSVTNVPHVLICVMTWSLYGFQCVDLRPHATVMEIKSENGTKHRHTCKQIVFCAQTKINIQVLL